MNKAITDGLVLMPPPFSAGLGLWSSGDGTPGSPTYNNQGNAAYVPADQDFGGCLELQKTDNVQKLRHMGQTPILPGCYLQVTVRIKAVSGSLPNVRVAAWAGDAAGNAVAGLPLNGVETTLTQYGTVVEVSAIIGTGHRAGVDMPWGLTPVYAHIGLDLTGPTGGVVRIDDLIVEDATRVFLRDMMDWVDVRDYGAVGDGITDDTSAFLAADAAATGGGVLVSEGTYHLGQDVTFDNRVRFEGQVTMPVAAILTLSKNFELPSYIDAFGSEEVAFRKAFQCLLNNADHESLDLGGRRISVSGPIDMQAAVPNRTSYAQRRVIRNGQLRAEDTGAWAPQQVTSVGTYDPAVPTRLSNVTNIANVQVGSLVQGAGVGREVYVRDVNVAAQTLTLSMPLSDATGSQTFTFTRFQFLLDFSGFASLQDFELTDVEFQCNGLASGALLAIDGSIMQFRDCVFNRPGHRGIASPGEACQGMLVDRCKFLSNESSVLAQNRGSIALSANANDVKLRDNRATRFKHFAVLSGSYIIVSNNHFFQGDDAANGVRTAGIVLTQRNCHATISGNYIDNCSIEWTNEREPDPNFSGGFGFSGLSMNDNICLCSNVAPWFAFLVIKPYGTGHFVNGLSVTGNTFRTIGGTIDRVDRVDTSFAPLDLSRMFRIDYAANTYHNVTTRSYNPLIVSHAQNTAAVQWDVDTAGQLPFAGQALDVSGLVARGRVETSNNTTRYDLPYTTTQHGTNKDHVLLVWPTGVRGTMNVTVRCDK